MSDSLRVELSQLGRTEQLGKGGTALVYRVPDLKLPGQNNAPLVYKEYTDKTRKLAGAPLGSGLQRFVQFRERLPERQREIWDARIIWPVRVVVDDNKVTGILMALIPDQFFHEFRRRERAPARRPREIETLFGDNHTMSRVGLPQVDEMIRLRLILGIASAYGMMHKEGVVLGDISGRNVVYDPNPARPAVLVVDVDSARISGTRSVFSSQPHTPNWVPPEARVADGVLQRANSSGLTSQQRDRLRNTWAVQSTKTDVYKFGLMVTRVLDYGRGKAINLDPAGAQRVLRRHVGNEAALLLDRSLSPEPNSRPTMREWYDVLSQGRTRKDPGPALPQPTPETRSGIPAGRRVGNWTWDENKGWVRAGRP